MAAILDTFLAETPGVCGGRIRIDGTRITVHRVAWMYKQGESPEEIVGEYPQLNLAQVYAALAWYHTNQGQVDAELAADRAELERLARENSGRKQ